MKRNFNILLTTLALCFTVSVVGLASNIETEVREVEIIAHSYSENQREEKVSLRSNKVKVHVKESLSLPKRLFNSSPISVSLYILYCRLMIEPDLNR